MCKKYKKTLAINPALRYSMYTRPVGQGVKTPPSHGGIKGSIPLSAMYTAVLRNCGFLCDKPAGRSRACTCFYLPANRHRAVKRDACVSHESSWRILLLDFSEDEMSEICLHPEVYTEFRRNERIKLVEKNYIPKLQ